MSDAATVSDLQQTQHGSAAELPACLHQGIESIVVYSKVKPCKVIREKAACCWSAQRCCACSMLLSHQAEQIAQLLSWQ